jgi:hypothetical protein
VYRFSAFPVPDNRRFALVGNADAIYFIGGERGGFHCAPANFQRRTPYLIRVVFHPAVLRVVLPELLLMLAYSISFFVEDYCAAACCPLVYGKKVGRHDEIVSQSHV